MAAKYTMDINDKNILRTNISYITKNLRPIHVLDYLYEKKIFSCEEKDEILAEKTVQAKNRRLVMGLMKRGPAAFKTFIHALMEDEQVPVARQIDAHGLVDEWIELQPKDEPRPAYVDAADVVAADVTSDNTAHKAAVESNDRIIQFEMLTVKEEDVKHLIDHENVYCMTNKSRGRVIIINNEKFTDQPKRLGSATDAANLDKLFHALHFTVSTEMNTTAQDIREIIEEETDKTSDNEKSDCFIVFLLSHGGRDPDDRDYVLGTQGQKVYIKDEIVAPFCGDNCPSLKGKPKLFFVQACEPVDYDETDACPLDANPPFLSRHLSVVEKDVRDDDVCCVHSTLRGRGSLGLSDLGSPFVRKIVTVFSRNAYTHSFAQMLATVNSEENTPPTLAKDLYFLPGYFR